MDNQDTEVHSQSFTLISIFFRKRERPAEWSPALVCPKGKGVLPNQ